jgi:hypothetical protein
MILESAGGILVIAGLIAGITMISISVAPHLRYAHDILGTGTLILIACTLLLGISMMTMVLAQQPEIPGISEVRYRFLEKFHYFQNPMHYCPWYKKLKI